ncbi:hypothetical protein TWF281_009663 [Arthrobotrys megalospora]
MWAALVNAARSEWFYLTHWNEIGLATKNMRNAQDELKFYGQTVAEPDPRFQTLLDQYADERHWKGFYLDDTWCRWQLDFRYQKVERELTAQICAIEGPYLQCTIAEAEAIIRKWTQPWAAIIKDKSLHLLEDITVTMDSEGQKVFSLTEAGEQAFLEELEEIWGEVLKKMEEERMLCRMRNRLAYMGALLPPRAL